MKSILKSSVLYVLTSVLSFCFLFLSMIFFVGLAGSEEQFVSLQFYLDLFLSAFFLTMTLFSVVLLAKTSEKENL